MATTQADRERSAALTAALGKSRTALGNLLARRGVEEPRKGDLWKKAKDCGADRTATARAFLRDSNALASQYVRQAYNVSNAYYSQYDQFFDDAVSESLHGLVLAARKFEMANHRDHQAPREFRRRIEDAREDRIGEI